MKIVNKIKCNAKNDRIFRQMCQNNDEQFIRLLLHTEVRWLSKGVCLTRFVALYASIIQFLEENDEIDLCHELKIVKNDAFYLANIFKRFEDVNLQLQGAFKTLICCKNTVSLFIEKLHIFRRNLLKKEFHQFPNLFSIKEDITPEEIERFSDHIKQLALDMKVRFNDILNFKISNWMFNPFTVDVNEVDIVFQEEILELKYDEESKNSFNKHGIAKLWQNKKMPKLYPKMWENMKNILIPFPTSYLVESGFSAVNNIMSKQRNRLNITERGDFRLFLTKIEPDMNEIISKHQAQGSH
ncbi:SCAN domain-containing protein 3 [Trichonephila clavata]|uniref:SCAN domain-containing protein 3 n=1 Tax=Trichonephila clavata TaxID=2740835 RepID=A0A8X6KH70_TRICU|nr:SCAN domain-containing protein 3 [Trichonephila clavata]